MDLMKSDKITLICVFMLLEMQMTASEQYDRIKCSHDSDQNIAEGSVANIGRFPWLGIVQHSFYLGGAVRFAITTGVLIHPAYAVAPAEDIGRILRDQLLNNTKFVVWYSKDVKYAMDVIDFILHPEFVEKRTLATIALVQLQPRGETTFGENKNAVLPVCLPSSGAGLFTKMYAVRMSDANGDLHKEVYKMQYVNDSDCNDFYLQNKLSYAKMSPVTALCAAADQPMPPCVWDGGAALITRQSWGFWRILGFSVRGPGCGAPARFLVLNDYVEWIDSVVARPESPDEEDDEEHAIGFRRLSPIKLIMYSIKKDIAKDIGNCDRKERGGVLYKDAFEVTMTKDFGQGYFYTIISQLAQFTCAKVNFAEATSRTNTAIWLEHYCHRELTGLAHGQTRPFEYRKQECFLYFKSTAFVKFRFYFSFKAMIEVTLYGTEEIPRLIPNPFAVQEATDDWYPTTTKLNWDTFYPRGFWWFGLR